MTSAELIERWELKMRAAGNTDRTIGERLRVLRQVTRATGERPEDLTSDSLAAWLAQCPSASTRCSYWGSLGAWFTWLVDVEELRPDNPMRKLQRPRVPRRRPRPVADEHLRLLLTSGIRGRTRTWVLLAALEGLRVHEIAKVRGEDVDRRMKTLRVVGKGGVDEELPLHPMIAAEARRYPREGYWFPSYEAYGRAGEPVLGATVSITISRAMRRAGVPGTAHSLRHWYGTNVLRTAKGNLRVAQELLRHASPATTALYTKVDDSERRAAIAALAIGDAAS